MINYRLKDSVVTHFPAIFKGLGSKPSVIHMALDVELHGAVLVARVAGSRPIHCGKYSRSTLVQLANELVRGKHRVVLAEEACGFELPLPSTPARDRGGGFCGGDRKHKRQTQDQSA